MKHELGEWIGDWKPQSFRNLKFSTENSGWHSITGSPATSPPTCNTDSRIVNEGWVLVKCFLSASQPSTAWVAVPVAWVRCQISNGIAHGLYQAGQFRTKSHSCSRIQALPVVTSRKPSPSRTEAEIRCISRPAPQHTPHQREPPSSSIPTFYHRWLALAA